MIAITIKRSDRPSRPTMRAPNEARAVVRAGVPRLFVALAAALPIGAFAVSAHADDAYHWNPTIVNDTNSPANDYHVRFTAATPITVGATFLCPTIQCPGTIPFTSATVSNNGTTNVTINYSGTQLNVGQSTHLGASLTVAGGANALSIAESWWTLDGLKITGSQGLTSFHCTGSATNWVVAQTKLFTDMAGTNQIGNEFAECHGDTVTISNQITGGGTIFASTAFTPPSATEVPLSSLNPSLPGFGAFGPIVALPPPSGVPGLPPWALALLGGALLLPGAYFVRRRLTASSEV